MTFHIITLFPESFESYINSSIIGRAVRDKKIKIKFYNPRDFVPTSQKQKLRGASKPYLRVDDKAYGGGPGMVMQAMPVIRAIEKALKNSKSSKLLALSSKLLIIWLSPPGKQFDNKTAQKFTKYTDIIIICGRYEGIDARVKKVVKDFKLQALSSKLDFVEISVGPYVLTGGELPAMVILDTVARRIPGVLGKIESVEENRTASKDVYTRPEILTHKNKKYRVPKVLLSGHHKNIEEWRKGK